MVEERPVYLFRMPFTHFFFQSAWDDQIQTLPPTPPVPKKFIFPAPEKSLQNLLRNQFLNSPPHFSTHPSPFNSGSQLFRTATQCVAPTHSTKYNFTILLLRSSRPFGRDPIFNRHPYSRLRTAAFNSKLIFFFLLHATSQSPFQV